jgi:hypothetical protein
MLTARFGLSTILDLPISNQKTVREHLLDQAQVMYPGLINPKITGSPVEVQGDIGEHCTPDIVPQDIAPEPLYRQPGQGSKARRLKRRDKNRPLNPLVRAQLVQAAKHLATLFQQHKLDQPYNFDDHLDLLNELSANVGDDSLQAISQLLKDATDSDMRCPK